MQHRLKEGRVAPLLRVVVPHGDRARPESAVESIDDISKEAKPKQEDKQVEDEHGDRRVRKCRTNEYRFEGLRLHPGKRRVLVSTSEPSVCALLHDCLTCVVTMLSDMLRLWSGVMSLCGSVTELLGWCGDSVEWRGDIAGWFGVVTVVTMLGEEVSMAHNLVAR